MGRVKTSSWFRLLKTYLLVSIKNLTKNVASPATALNVNGDALTPKIAGAHAGRDFKYEQHKQPVKWPLKPQPWPWLEWPLPLQSKKPQRQKQSSLNRLWLTLKPALSPRDLRRICVPQQKRHQRLQALRSTAEVIFSALVSILPIPSNAHPRNKIADAQTHIASAGLIPTTRATANVAVQPYRSTGGGKCPKGQPQQLLQQQLPMR
jgi:hypothetical protein